ncbi:MAG: phage virion morphogenesis protein [Treponema sp.]|jgi:phage virion morphogenesis protein|nr:phage virion morphogenesis protein [Treponema sp.]
MAGAVISLGLKEVEGLARILNGVKLASEDRVQLLKDIGVELESQTQERFDTQKDPDGNKWKELAQKTRDYYMQNGLGKGSLLVQEGSLRDTITSRVSDSWSVLVGATMIYAAIHQWGGEIVPKAAAALYVPGYGKLKKVTIPARPYLGVSSQDAADIAAIAQGFAARRFK